MTHKDETNDTSPAAEAILIAGFRTMPAWRKLALLAELNKTVEELVWSGLARRHPGASPEELRRRLADIRLGPALAERVYGAPSPEDVN